MHYKRNLIYCFFILFFVLQKMFIICDVTLNPKRAMLIFLDIYEFAGTIKGGAVFWQLTNALNQECCPILVSGALLANLSLRHTALKKEIKQELPAKIERFRNEQAQGFDKVDVFL